MEYNDIMSEFFEVFEIKPQILTDHQIVNILGVLMHWNLLYYFNGEFKGNYSDMLTNIMDEILNCISEELDSESAESFKANIRYAISLPNDKYIDL